MTLAGAFLRSLGIGLLVAVPVGAMALRCIERTLTRGRVSGYATGAGIATADALYASIAAFGLTALTSALASAQSVVQVVGGAFLMYLGIAAALSRPRECEAPRDGTVSTLAAYGSALTLTLANPQTIVMFAGIFSGAGLASPDAGWAGPAVTVAGVFVGSLAWWFVLVTIVSVARERAGDRMLLWVTRASGAAIAVFGALTLWAGITA